MIDFFLTKVTDAKQQQRYRTLVRTLEPLRTIFEGKNVLDFGASHGTGICALIELGASVVTGVEPGSEYVSHGIAILKDAPYASQASLLHVADTSRLPFPDEHFDVVLVNAVLEHIPQPREAYLREISRVLGPGGYIIVNETPNKYLPKEVHTTHLWLIHWLPSDVAHKYAIWRGRFRADQHWESSGWRGLGYFELRDGLGPGFTLVPEEVRLRHRVFRRLGIPASILDPYPNWILRKSVSA